MFIFWYNESVVSLSGRSKREEESIFHEMDFMSTIITQDDGYSISKGKGAEIKSSSISRNKMDHNINTNNNRNEEKMKTSSSCNVQGKYWFL